MKSRELIFIGIILFVISLLVRLPYFFPAVLDWDESTYILMGQSVLDGHLPYVELWDNKPPLIFYQIAAFILFFGKSITAIRIGATLCVFITAFFLYLIGRRFFRKYSSLFVSILYIFCTSLLLSGQSALSEHLALAFLLPAIYLYFIKIRIFVKFLFIGILLACACYIRTNLGIVCLAYGLYFFVDFLNRKEFKSWIKAILGFSTGVLSITFIMILPYIIHNEFHLWWQSVVKAPLAYSVSQYSVFEILVMQSKFIIRNLIHPATVNTVSVLIIAMGIIGIVFFIVTWKRYSVAFRKEWIFLLILFMAVDLSMLLGGAFWPKYLAQIIPFMSLSTVFIINLVQKKIFRGIVITLFIAILVLTSKDIIYEYKKMTSRYNQYGKMTYGPAYEVKSYLEKNNIEPEKAFLLTQHIVYWLMNSKPLTKEATHPSNIYLDYILDEIEDKKTTPFQLMKKILMNDPEVIVVTDKPYYYVDPKADSLLQRTISEKYYLARMIKEPVEQTLIYRKCPR